MGVNFFIRKKTIPGGEGGGPGGVWQKTTKNTFFFGTLPLVINISTIMAIIRTIITSKHMEFPIKACENTKGATVFQRGFGNPARVFAAKIKSQWILGYSTKDFGAKNQDKSFHPARVFIEKNN